MAREKKRERWPAWAFVEPGAMGRVGCCHGLPRFSYQAQMLLPIRLKELHAGTVGLFFRAASGPSSAIYMGNGIAALA
jgi:hypothetical protein